MVEASPRVRGVCAVTYEHAAQLRLAGLLPWIDLDGPDSPHSRPPRRDELADVSWWVTGDVERPTGMLALREGYDLKATRDVLEIVGVSGSRTAIGRLVKFAIERAKENGRRVVGDLDFDHDGIEEFAAALRFKRARTRWELEPNG